LAFEVSPASSVFAICAGQAHELIRLEPDERHLPIYECSAEFIEAKCQRALQAPDDIEINAGVYAMATAPPPHDFRKLPGEST
jgi:hypothetical protein